MKNIFILITLLLTITQANAYSTKIKTAHAIGIFHKNENFIWIKDFYFCIEIFINVTLSTCKLPLIMKEYGKIHYI